MKTGCLRFASKRLQICCLLTTLLVIQTGLARATVFVWTNTAGGNFSNSTNWSPAGVPGSGDTAYITNAGTYTVVFDVTNTGGVLLGAGGGANGVQSLGVTNNQYGSGIEANFVVTNGGVLNANNDLFYRITALVENGGVWNSQNSIYGGVPIEVTNAVFVSGNDQFLWTVTLDNGAQFFSTNLFNDTVEPTSVWQVNTGAVVTIDNGVFLIEGFVTNAGTINIETNGVIQLVNNNDTVSPYVNGELVNAPGGLINIYYTGSGGISNIKPGSGEGYELFINQGTVINYGFQALILVTELDNTSGTVINMSANPMRVGYFQADSGNLSGNYYVTNGGSIQFWGGEVPSLGDIPTNPAVVASSVVLSGPGQYGLYNGSFILTNNIFPNLLLAGGTLSLGTNFQGGAITNLSLDGITLTNTLPVTGTLNDTNSIITGNFTVTNGGVLNAFYTSYLDGNVTVAGGGLFDDVSGLVLNSPGSVNVQNGGTLLLNSSFTLNSAVTNYGVLTLTNGGGISINYNGLQNLGELVNAFGGVIQINGGGSGISGGSGCDFINQGQITKNFSSSGVNINVTDFDNSAGTVTNLEGTLEVGNFVGTLAGTFYASNGTTIQITGGAATNYLTPGTPLVLGGGGSYRFISGYLDLPNDIVPGLVLQGGTLMLGPGFQGGAITNLALDGILLTNTLTVTGTFNVTNSPVYGAFIITNGGVLNTYGGPNFHSGISVASGGLFNDANGGTIQSDGWLSIAAGGTLDLEASLNLYGVLTNYGTINTTNWSIGLGSSLAGIVNEAGANLFIYGGGGVGGGGYLINEGTITKSLSTGQATMSVTSFTNAGAITAQHGNFSLNTVTLLPIGSLNLNLNSAADYGSFSFSGNAGLAGTLNVWTNNYTPAIGTIFNLATYRSFSGSFSSLNLPSGVGGWQTGYAPTVLQIQAGLPSLAAPVFTSSNLVLNVTNGLAGNQYRVLSTTNLALPVADWTPLTTNNFVANGKFSFTNSAANLPQQFFILSSP